MGQGQQGSQAPPRGKISSTVGEGGGAGVPRLEPFLPPSDWYCDLPTPPSLLQGQCILALP